MLVMVVPGGRPGREGGGGRNAATASTLAEASNRMFLVMFWSNRVCVSAAIPPAGAGCGLRNYSTTPRKLSSPAAPAAIGWPNDQRMWVTSAATARAAGAVRAARP